MTAGYRIYKRLTPDGDDTLVQTVAAGTDHADLTGFSAGSEQYFHARAVSACGIEDEDPIRLRRVAFDGAGNLILAVPNAPGSLRLSRGAAGRVIAAWQYLDGGQEVAPAVFNIYVATGDGSFNFAPASTLNYVGPGSYTMDLGTFADGTLVRVIVRAKSQAGSEEANMSASFIRADAAAPPVPTLLALEAEAG